MLYPDTSILLAIYLGEPSGDRVLKAIAGAADDLAVSGWLHLEFASTLAIKERGGLISGERRQAALADFNRQWLVASTMLPILPRCYSRAVAMMEQGPGLRGSDALHLAIAEASGATLVTLDIKQANLGEKLGVSTQMP